MRFPRTWLHAGVVVLLSGLLSPTPAHTAPPPPLRLTIEPAQLILEGSHARQQVAVSGYFDDGSVRDLTAGVTFAVQDASVARWQGSVVTAAGDGDTIVTVSLGALKASAPVTVRDSRTTRPLSFVNDVMPILSKAGCNAGTCHGNFNGKNGFRLSLRGENPAFDLDSLTRDTQARRTNPFLPEASLILQKPRGEVPHEGGVRFRKDSAESAALKRWIAEGMRPDPSDTPRLSRLDVWPRDRVLLNGAGEQQIVVRATFSDGASRDVTHLTCYEPNIEIARVSPAGLVTADKSGEVTILVRYLDQRAPVRLAFVPERPDFRWTDVKANNYIDEHIYTRLKALRMQPSGLCDDATFLRRVYLDLCGILPTPAEARAFLADRDAHKRSKLVERLLERPEYAEYWALKWADLLRNEEKAVDAKGVRHVQHWLKQWFSDDRPLDRFARELLTSQGSTYEQPAANFFRTNLEPQKAAETTAILFLGTRIACAKCHNHPFDRWTQEDYYGLSAFFARVKTRMLENERRDKLDKHELKGEMIVWLDREGEVAHPTTGDRLSPRLPGGSSPKISDETDRRAALADWLVRPDNPYFARNMANRIWYHLLGRGLVEPVDDLRESNPASNEPLLDALASDLTKHNCSQKHLIRRIANSRTYQLSSRPTPTNAEDESNFSHVIPRMLSAESLLDAISQVTEVPEEFKGHPRGTRAVQLPGVQGGTRFLIEFGRPDRLLACECERGKDATLNQAFQMISSETINRKVQDSPRLARLLERNATHQEIITELYLAALSRYPGERELQTIGERLGRALDRRRAVEDLLWAVLNMKEFLLRR